MPFKTSARIMSTGNGSIQHSQLAEKQVIQKTHNSTWQLSELQTKYNIFRNTSKPDCHYIKQVSKILHNTNLNF